MDQVAFIYVRDGKSELSSKFSADDRGLVLRYVRGKKMRSLQGVFDEFSAALQFPWYFGDNRDAFDECIADREWLPRASRHVVVIFDAETVLEGNRTELEWLIASLQNANSMDSEAPPLQILLQSEVRDPRAVDTSWGAAGAQISRPET